MSSVDVGEMRERSMSYPVYKLYRIRFYVLFVYSLLSFNQCLIWITYSPISDEVEKHYGIKESTVDLLTAWGPIFFIPCLPLTYLLLNQYNGLRYCILLLSTIDVFSTIIRVIPLIFVSPSSINYHRISVPFIHIGQILNAICGPLAMVPVTQISSLWFDTNERTRATTVAIMAYNLGSTTGFFLGPSVVDSPDKVPHLLYIHIGLSVVGCLFSWIYFPGEPPTPPSPAAELLLNRGKNKEKGFSWKSSLRNIEKCFQDRSFVLLVCGGGLIGGTYGAWTALFDNILTPENYTEDESGWFGFSSNIAEIIGGLILSIIADLPRFNRSFKLMIIIAYISYFVSISWFNLSISSLFYSKKVVPSNRFTIGISVTLAGLFQGSASPLIYESLAEFLYPAPESLSASILVLFINITALILFFIAPNRSKLMNFIILIFIIFSIILIFLTKFHYRRRDADNNRRNTLVAPDDPLFNRNPNEILDNTSSDEPIPEIIQMDPIQNLSFLNPLHEQSHA